MALVTGGRKVSPSVRIPETRMFAARLQNQQISRLPTVDAIRRR